MPVTFSARGPIALPPVVTYQGPGDIVAGAVGWWGLRAYSSAQTTGSQAAIDIVKTSDGSAPMTINILSTGALDVATIAGLGYGVSVTKWYDQTGNGQDLTQSTLANMPVLTLSAIGALPTLTLIGTKSFTKTLFTETQPATVTAFTRCIDTTAGTQTVFTCTSYAMTLDNGQPLGGPIAPQMVGSGGSLSGYPKSINTWYAIAGLYNSTSSDFRFDGTSVATGDVGTGAPSNQTITVGGTLSNFNVCEIGTWQSTFSGQFGNMSTNQHTYWGI